MGYSDYGSYRPWLRDEFSFRCVYCLLREQWGIVQGTFALDHFEPKAMHPERAVDYDNLLYSCVTCNLNKGDLDVSDPLRTLISSTVYVARSGEIQSNSSEAAKLIELLRLNRPQYVEFRKLWINMVRLAADHDPELYQRLMQFPSELPDLQRLRPPGGNKRREGLEQSHFARREQGELPATY